MRVLLDEHLNWRLSRYFAEDLEAESVGWQGWKGEKNGELLTLMEAAGFEVLITTDKGIPHQQNLAKYKVAVVALQAKSNRLEDTAPLVEAYPETIRSAPPGKATSIPPS